MGTVSPLQRPGAIARFADGLANLYSRLGTGADRNTQSHYFVPPLDQQQIEAAYRTSWLTRKVHDLPPFEMTRAGRVWQAQAPQITKLETAERQFDIWGKLCAALRTARLHGGAALVLGVRQGMPDQPLIVDRLGVNTLRYVLVVSKHQLTAPRGMDYDAESDFYGQPAMYELRGAKGNAVQIHPSRVIPFHGAPLPSGSLTVSHIDQFWGDPLLLSIKSAIDNAETSQAAIATLLHEMKQDVISIPGLTEQIATEGAENRLGARIEALNRLKSMFNALLLDGGDPDTGAGAEKWETRQLSFAQHPELLDKFLGIVAGAADIPITRLMGESPGGMQSTGKGEQHDFNRMIGALQGAHLGPALPRLDEVLIRSTLGNRDPDIGYTFAPLSESDEQQESENEKREAETVQIYANTNLIPKDALAKSAANRLIESGRWPGLDQAIQESAEELGAIDEPDELPAIPPAANDDEAVDRLQQRGTITRDQALLLLADATPRSLYVRRDLLNVREFTAWAEAQGFDVQDGLHVTIAYSETPVDWFAVSSDDWGDSDGKLTVAPGGPRLVERFDGGAIVLQFASSRLGYRHEEIKRAGASSTYPEYSPHVTITAQAPEGLDLSAIEPYRGKLEFGPEIFEQVKG